ncbi:hypothetical protein NliqN6_1659 [Naganishia liquefaciens]|uniref:NADPH:adrenodoxin oxidoreductase, mitochondrial n=1 Tax=Naganishia liquefaciens TaxID=104408 RepID=A0A8H3YEH5_9TREE|nr:hypothetical protein NliqN6_1659 [Naganishia liquefaciens]
MTTIRPLKLAIIGAGPSGFYTASRILSLLPADSEKGKHVSIHMYDRLPTPYGLVRYGVAPDHPEVKNCQEKFDGLAADPRFRFFGNVSVGTTSSPSSSATTAYTYPDAVHLPLSQLVPYYSTVLFTYGSSLSNPLPRTAHSAFSASPLQNVLPALAFVSWYNGHPAYTHLTDLLDLSAIDEATVIGHGNVAIDVARMLLKSPDALAHTDMPTPVVEKLRASRIRKVSAVGRRGPAQVSFTTKEFREMVNLPGVKFNSIDETLMADARRMVEGDRPRKRLMDLMSKGGKSTGDTAREFELGFLKSPQAFLAAEDATSGTSPSQKVSHIKWSINTLLAPPAPPPHPPHPPAAPATTTDETPSTAVVARPTGEETTTRAGLVIESVGYRSESLSSGAEGELALPFDEKRGRIANEGGRVVDESGIMIPGFYTAGWVASGPIGVIASTMQYAYSVASLIINDHFIQPPSSNAAALSNPLPSSPEHGLPQALLDAGAQNASVPGGKAGKRVVEMRDWERIDRVEVERGREVRKPREKILSVKEMLEVLP